MNFGIPRQDQYRKLLKSKLFKQMEVFSNNFLASNNDLLRKYARKWVVDPLHQWNRQWEYPFVFYHISKLLKKHDLGKMNILDAGSGITFFPYYLLCVFNHKIKLWCVDKDRMLSSIISGVNEANKVKLNFKTKDLLKLSFPDQSFEVVYCISVLEHMKDQEKVIKEFYRVIKKGGYLIVTFDLSLDNQDEITLARATDLLCYIEGVFNVPHKPLLIPPDRNNVETSFINTKYFQNKNPQLLPWKYPVLSIMKRFFKIKLALTMPNLTIYCAVFRKH